MGIPGRSSGIGAIRLATGNSCRRNDRNPRATTLTLAIPDRDGHLPVQHVDVRLTAEDGYQPQRSYSIDSAADGTHIQLLIERLDEGEVSPYLIDELRAGDLLELREPIGDHFTWHVATGGPLFLVAGGSGVAPLMAMIRHRARAGSRAPTRLLFSSRSWDDISYRDELARLSEADDTLEVVHTLTRTQPAAWTGNRRRIDPAMLAEVAWPSGDWPVIHVCGQTPLVEAVASGLVDLGHDAMSIKTERFGRAGE
jgi:ferredoxin-NADP reductase